MESSSSSVAARSVRLCAGFFSALKLSPTHADTIVGLANTVGLDYHIVSDPSDLVARMCADVEAAIHYAPRLEVGIVQDGAAEMWSATRAGLQCLVERGVIPHWHEAIDRFHLLERLADALAIIESDADTRREVLDDWRERLDAQDCAIDRIERYLMRHYSEASPKKQEQLWEHLRYVQNNKDRMRYVDLEEPPAESGLLFDEPEDDRIASAAAFAEVVE